MLAVVGLRERVLLKQIKRKKIQNIQMVPSPGGDVMQLLPPLALNVHGGIRRGTRRYGAGIFFFFFWLSGGGLLGWAGKCALKWQMKGWVNAWLGRHLFRVIKA